MSDTLKIKKTQNNEEVLGQTIVTIFSGTVLWFLFQNLELPRGHSIFGLMFRKKLSELTIFQTGGQTIIGEGTENCEPLRHLLQLITNIYGTMVQWLLWTILGPEAWGSIPKSYIAFFYTFPPLFSFGALNQWLHITVALLNAT